MEALVEMLGYVTIEKNELKIREYDIYRGYYCGVCKSIGARYGQLPRMILSYDAAFLAMVHASLSPGEDAPDREHCLIHPIKKNPVLSGLAVDYAGDVMILLAWHKLMDDVRDERKFSSLLGLLPLLRAFRRIRKTMPALSGRTKDHLDRLSALEKAKCASLDETADCFAKILEDVMSEGPGATSESSRRVLARLGYHLGKWIYLMDAWEDLEGNLKSGAYNPLVCRYGYQSAESPEEFKDRIRESCRWNLMVSLEETAKAADLLDIQKNRSIIENIVYMGLLRRTEAALRKEEQQDAQPL